jgi:hypothetical protein
LKTALWKSLFFGAVVGYCLYYAPYGLNETDGGFLTGLAWQVLSGKTLYHDIVYVRPPLPVWLRALELRALPEQFAVLGERWFFYAKVGLYTWLAAAMLAGGARHWMLATLGFVVSAHCYPPMAWHTVDGILFGVLAAYCSASAAPARLVLGGAALAAALLCKQSFYPLLPLFLLFLIWEKEGRWSRLVRFSSGFFLCNGLFFSYLAKNSLLSSYFQMTNGAASGGQAFQHGVLDYFRITPELGLPSLLLLAPVAWYFWRGQNRPLARAAWLFWLGALVASYTAVTWLRQEHTVPFAQSRALFWVAAAVVIRHCVKSVAPTDSPFAIHHSSLLLAITWCAAVSWGYNLPMLFATPWVWAAMECTDALWRPSESPQLRRWASLALLLALLLAFRAGHEFVYRDGLRSAMGLRMATIFPQLGGIYSDQETADLYQSLKDLAVRYPNFKTLPAFPQANFLTKTTPPLPLDWVVSRETNSDNQLIFRQFEKKAPVLLVQKTFADKIQTDPELAVTREFFRRGQILEETPHFWVLNLPPGTLD